MANKEKGVVIQVSYMEAAQGIAKKHRADYYEALIRYGCFGEEPDFSGFGKASEAVATACFRVIRESIDASVRRYAAAVENGKKGGAPKGNKNAAKKGKKQPEKQPENNLTITKTNTKTKTMTDKGTISPPYQSDLSASPVGGFETAAVEPPEGMTAEEAIKAIEAKRAVKEREEREAARREAERRDAEREAERAARRRRIDELMTIVNAEDEEADGGDES